MLHTAKELKREDQSGAESKMLKLSIWRALDSSAPFQLLEKGFFLTISLLFQVSIHDRTSQPQNLQKEAILAWKTLPATKEFFIKLFSVGEPHSGNSFLKFI
jgi:hypothetical protein